MITKQFTTLNGREAVVIGVKEYSMTKEEHEELLEELDNFYGSRGADWDLCYDQRISQWEQLNAPDYICKDVATGNIFYIPCDVLDV